MKFRRLLAAALLFAVSAFTVFPQRYISEESMRSRPGRSAGGHNPYEVPVISDTKAPRGYKPFYISHFGRHGSRMQNRVRVFTAVLPGLDSLASCGLLSPAGDSLRLEIRRMADAHSGREGMLTTRGEEEQRGVATRMASRFRRVFRRADAKTVFAVSTSVPRCIRSRDCFTGSLEELFPTLETVREEDKEHPVGQLSFRRPEDLSARIQERYLHVRDSLLRDAGFAATFASRIAPRAVLEPSFVYQVFEACQGSACLESGDAALRFFTPAELAGLAEIRNSYFFTKFGPDEATMDEKAGLAAPLARRIVLEADAALAGNGRCADLKFGHDSGLGPLMLLLGIEGFDAPVSLQDEALWPAWKYISMCSNLQMVFYRNRRGDVLVKFLRNEEEAMVPALTAVKGPYYRWSDVRKHILRGTGDYRPLPDYYAGWLEAKASAISALKKRESSGFLFWTDSHFPDNAGYTAPVLERLQEICGPSPLVFGGDATLNGSFRSGMASFMSCLLQAGLYGNLYPVRGNHDFTSSTHDAHPEETYDDGRTARWLSAFRSPLSAGTEGVNYCFYDDRKGRVRYVFLDTTDSVSAEGRVVYGMSGDQMLWLENEALGGLKPGWDAFVVTHVPVAPDQTTVPSLLEAGSLLGSPDTGSKVLMCLSGHKHSDIESSLGTVFQVLTAADCLRNTATIRTCVSSEALSKEAGTVMEQTMDYVSVSKRHDRVTMLRIGLGQDRIFNLRPVRLSAGGEVRLKSGFKSPVSWHAFDAGCGRVKRGADGVRRYECPLGTVSVSGGGLVTAQKEGNAIVAAVDESTGSKEFFMVSVSGRR